MNREVPALIEIGGAKDARGSFEQSFPDSAISQLRMETFYVATSWTDKKFTIRGLHYQEAPFSERKLVRVLSGSIMDVVVSLDESLPMEKRIHVFELESRAPQLLFIPEGFAHGFQTLEDETIVLYGLDNIYAPKAAKGINPLSPGLRDLWPFRPTVMKEADLAWPNLD